ncbi:hypothetical protein ACFX2F_030044 [Malus domestica]
MMKNLLPIAWVDIHDLDDQGKPIPVCINREIEILLCLYRRGVLVDPYYYEVLEYTTDLTNNMMSQLLDKLLINNPSNQKLYKENWFYTSSNWEFLLSQGLKHPNIDEVEESGLVAAMVGQARDASSKERDVFLTVSAA